MKKLLLILTFPFLLGLSPIRTDDPQGQKGQINRNFADIEKELKTCMRLSSKDESQILSGRFNFGQARITGGLYFSADGDLFIQDYEDDDSCHTLTLQRNVANEAPRFQVWNEDGTASSGRAMAIFDVITSTSRTSPTMKGSIVGYGLNYNVPEYAGFLKVSCNIGNGIIIRASDPAGYIKFLTGGDSASYEHFRIGANGDVGIKAGNKLFLDGIGLAGDTYIVESVGGNQINVFTGSTNILQLAASDSYVNTDLLSNTAASNNLGNAAYYWNDVSYKTLTDRGCLGSFDDGVELQDGSKVSDTAAIMAIKVNPTKETVYGAPMLDYKTFPKVAYKPADYKIRNSSGDVTGKALYPRDDKDEPYYFEVFDGTSTKQVYTEKDAEGYKTSVKKYAADGVEMTSMYSIMLGAIKELTTRVKTLEDKVTILESK
jgi:hypothetical protein